MINSKFTRDLFNIEYDVKLDVIYPASLQNFNSKDYKLKSKKYITFFSRIVDYKRPELILDLAFQYPNLQFIIMGGLPKNQISFFNSIKMRVLDESLNNITFKVNPTNSVVNNILSKTKIYFFPAKYEHFGITTIEAINMGAIPFVHDSGGQKEIVNNEILRFNDKNLLRKFNILIKMSDNSKKQIFKQLLLHTKRFSNQVFQDKMINYLNV